MRSRLSMVLPLLLLGDATGTAAASAGTSPLPSEARRLVAATLAPGDGPAVGFAALPSRTRPAGLETALLDVIAAWLAA